MLTEKEAAVKTDGVVEKRGGCCGKVQNGGENRKNCGEKNVSCHNS
jgi:hypothetical protein